MIWHKSSYSMNGDTNCVEVAWVKSSHSHASPASDCVEVGTALAKSSHSAHNGNCVEAGPCACGGDILVHDTKHCSDPDHCSQKLAFTQAEWAAFIAGAKDGEFDI